MNYNNFYDLYFGNCRTKTNPLLLPTHERQWNPHM